ncbi:MAG: hypothetical protein GY696_25110 [Gammaproteobacteria bacterium]|nr:hypothetical protein [Gammaproteobacteria bacterium]
MDTKELETLVEQQKKTIEDLMRVKQESADEIDRMRGHQTTLLEETKRAKAARGESSDAMAALMTKVEELENKNLVNDGNYEELLTRQTEKMKLEYEGKLGDTTAALEDFQNKFNALNTRYQTEKVNVAVRKAAEAANVLPSAIDDVIYRSNGVFSLGEDGSIEARDPEGNLRKIGKKQMTPDNFVESLKDAAPHFWPASQSAGASGAGGPAASSGPNPFSKDTVNYTEQAKLIKSDPERAEKLRAEAQG